MYGYHKMPVFTAGTIRYKLRYNFDLWNLTLGDVTSDEGDIQY